MKIVLFGGNRHSTMEILNTMLARQVEVVGCVMPEKSVNPVSKMCEENGIPVFSNAEMYECLEKGSFPSFDVGISWLYGGILKAPIIDFARQNIINFHPAPVEIHRGVAACCYCLLQECEEWAVTAHYVSVGIDEGDIIEEKRFPVKGLETAIEAEKYIQRQAVELFDDILTALINGKELPRRKQDLSAGRYFSRKDLERVKVIQTTDGPNEIDKKIDALWMPPYHGAYIEIGGKKYSLVNEKILTKLAKLYDNPTPGGGIKSTLLCQKRWSLLDCRRACLC